MKKDPPKFSELLDSQRLRPLWERHRGPTPQPSRDDAHPQLERPEVSAPPDLGPSHLEIESTATLMAELDKAIGRREGPHWAMMRYLAYELGAALRGYEQRRKTGQPKSLDDERDVGEIIRDLDDAVMAALAAKNK